MAKQENQGRRALAVLAIGVLMLGAGGYGFFQLTSYYEEKIADARRPPDTIEVIVASRDLFQGIAVTEDDLFQVDIEEKFVPAGVYRSADHVIGRVPRDRILANEFIREERLADAKAGLGLNALIPRGFRAISLNIQAAQAGAGFVRPENYVDVLVTITNPLTGERETRPVLQAVYVLAVNDQTGQEQEEEVASKGKKGKKGKKGGTRKSAPSVTFAVTPEQAEQLAQADTSGTLQILIRNGMEPMPEELAADVVGFSWEALKPKPEPKPKPRPTAPKPEPEPQGLIIQRGGRVTFEQDN
ncbi:MAG: Flp pilus assembly protein CpaB [Deltaproteobacteria bacterium]|nr:MAG: Flp pilus assembly protein CpaB [Deltaproteobacteria bacterium]